MRWRDIKQGKKQIVEPMEQKTKVISDIAPITNRVKAAITDSFMITIPILYIVIYFVMDGRESFEENMSTGWLYILIPHLIVVLGFWFVKGQTPGYKAYGIKLVEVGSGDNPNIALLIIRYVFIIVSIITILGLLLAYFRKDRRTLHDLISGTYPKAI